LLFTSASAMRYMVASVPSRLKLFTAHKTNLQFLGVYPPFTFFRSMLGERFLFLYPRRFLGPEKAIPVRMHFPVHVRLAHIAVKVNATLFLTARRLALSSRGFHG